jgi:uncharacterized membrane protein YfcA
MSTHLLVTILLIGLFAGILSGLVGVGGGVVMVPCMIYFLNYPQHQAQGTSLGVLILPVAIFAFFSYYQKLKGSPNQIDYKVILLLALGFAAGGLLGGNLAIRLDQNTLRKIFAMVLFYTAIKLLEWDKLVLQWFR